MAKPVVDVSGLTYKAKSEDNAIADPEDAKYRVALVGCYVDSHPMGGSDKVTSGHRFDSVGIANGLRRAGIAVQMIFYNVAEHDRFFEVVRNFDAVVMRINPGQITANGGDQQKFDKAMTQIAAQIPVWPTPANMEQMGAKDALTKIRKMDFGLPDTLGYYSPEDLKREFPKTVAFEKRVVKQNRGSAGEGIWIIELKNKIDCDNYGDRAAAMDEVLICKEANDNHVEEHTVAEFIEWCENGRTDKSGEWTSKGSGKYFEGGVEAGGQMVDQRFLPRIDEGESRFVMIGKKLFRVEHYKYIGGVGGETETTIYPADSADFPNTDLLPLKKVQDKLEKEIPDYLAALGLGESDIPLLWAADFIPVDNHKGKGGDNVPLVIGEFNCSCLGLAGFLDARGGDLMALPAEKIAMGEEMSNKIGTLAREQLDARAQKAKPVIDVSGLTYKAKSDDSAIADPSNAQYRVALVGCYVDSHPMGGSDKVTSGHRFDSVGIANGLRRAGIAVQMIFYNVAEHDKFFEVVGKFDAVVMRINPGQITANGGDQQKFDKAMTEIAAKIPVWPTPANMEQMGAKDALTKIKDMDFGLPDTLGYYSPADLKSGFPKTVAFEKRVVKQNRGSAGEGIWIIELKDKKECPNFGDRVAGMDEVLICKEANDNHVEEHTVGEFIEWCENGRTDKSGEWTSKGSGKYFEGGVEAGGQMVDQRFLPRIDEGESRFVMIGKKLFRVEHYVYIGGVGGETKTTIYPASAPDFPNTDALPLKQVQDKLEAEIPEYLQALGLGEKDIPLLWAADFIPVDNHKGKGGASVPLVIGEFNCSCLGLAGFLDARGGDLMALPAEKVAMGEEMSNKIGTLAREQLDAL